MTEQWKAIPGYEGYEASNLGNVRSIDRIIETKRGVKKSMRGKVLSPGVHSTEHPYPLYQLGRGRMIGGHVAVALAFLGQRPPGMYVCHKDGDETNNVPGNLYYGTPSDNQQDRRKHGTALFGERSTTAKLTQLQVCNILDMLASGEFQKDIAALYGISQSQVSNIKLKKRWAQ